MMNRLPNWTTDIRWTKLRQFEYGEPSDHVEEIKKTLHSASDESDEEWLAQLERDYATSRRRQRKWNSLERGLTLALVLCIAFTVCLASAMIYNHYTAEEIPSVFEAEICQSNGCVSAAYNIMNYVDEKVNPCDDFYGYACGNWLKNVFVPTGQAKWTAFHQLLDKNLMVLKKILDRKYLGLNSTGVLLKVQDFYTACMNKTAIEKNAVQSLKDLIHFVGSWTVTNVEPFSEANVASSIGNKSILQHWSPETWNFDQVLSKMHKLKSTPLFYMFVSADDKNSSENVIQVQQAGISLPDPDYYKRNESDKVVQAYRKLMVNVGVLLGGDPNSTRVEMGKVFEFERKLAEIYEPKEKMRQTEKIYHKMTIADLQKLAPAIPWMDYMNNMFSNPVTYEEQVVVYTPDYLKNMSDLVTKTERSVLANYMVWHLVKPLTSIMSKPFREASMEFLKMEKGIEGGSPTWKSCVIKTDSVFGFATGALFINENEGRGVKSEAETMISAIKEAFRTNLPLVEWMDDETRIKAVEKADAVFDMIGYPKWIEDPVKLDKYYADLAVRPDSNFENYISARRFYHQRTMNRRGKPVDRREWHMTPAEVNAYYNSPNNYIAFPSGILQRPFFDPDFPQSINFGAVGVVMGHELTHGFDSQGRLFDKHGNLVDWWRNESVVAFEEHAKCMVHQYENFTVAGKKVDGRQTLGENIADNGGLKMSYKAYQAWVEDNGVEMMLPGLNLTSEQLFFIGYAQVWCAATTESGAQHSLLVDKHSPEKVRVLAAVANSEDFAHAFSCPADSPMNPTKKCQVW